ncbi:hypothetical protein Sste5346_007262 [Sporothrix stenoceras]|uniref:Glycosyl transferase family protein n=1 Tax=Sporothrix stenoceras TaxID=5173 RepID=A0ABR3YW41_9PEZI
MSDGKRAVDSDKVWTTLITNLDYLPGLLTLDASLKKVKSAYPLVALFTDSFPEEGKKALAARGIPYQRIAYLLPTKSHRDYSADPRFYDCWSKLTPFGLTQYTRVVQLDSDMLVRHNMDELMDLPLDDPELAAQDPAPPTSRRIFAAGHACVCNPLGKKHYPSDWVPANCAFSLQHADPTKAQTEGADPDPALPNQPMGVELINGGLQVVVPNKVLFERIVSFMDENAADLDFADQSLLSTLFRGRWVSLPYTYNALKTLRWPGVHDPIWQDDSVKNVHYILTPNPWDELDRSAPGQPLKEGLTQDPRNVELHGWWAKTHRERKAAEAAAGIEDEW